MVGVVWQGRKLIPAALPWLLLGGKIRRLVPHGWRGKGVGKIPAGEMIDEWVLFPVRSGYTSENRVQLVRKVDTAGYTLRLFGRTGVKLGADQSYECIYCC